MVDQEEFGWRYSANISTGTVDKMRWCKQTFGQFGERWSVRFAVRHIFIFKRQEDHAMFVLAWHDDILKLD
jgi:hypothetical protein